VFLIFTIHLRELRWYKLTEYLLLLCHHIHLLHRLSSKDSKSLLLVKLIPKLLLNLRLHCLLPSKHCCTLYCWILNISLIVSKLGCGILILSSKQANISCVLSSKKSAILSCLILSLLLDLSSKKWDLGCRLGLVEESWGLGCLSLLAE